MKNRFFVAVVILLLVSASAAMADDSAASQYQIVSMHHEEVAGTTLTLSQYIDGNKFCVQYVRNQQQHVDPQSREIAIAIVIGTICRAKDAKEPQRSL